MYLMACRRSSTFQSWDFHAWTILCTFLLHAVGDQEEFFREGWPSVIRTAGCMAAEHLALEACERRIRSTLGKPGKVKRVNLKVSPPPGMGRAYVSWCHGYYEPHD
jgi:hypothetical protein